ncbi:MAG: FAD-dependent oxidoreductase [Flavobacteriaceae bacterium]
MASPRGTAKAPKRDTPAILIAGAGPTGLTAAVELARRGVSLRIVDRDEGPTPLSKAVGIAAHSLDILEPSGVTERLLAEGIRIRHVGAHAGGATLATLDFANLPHRYDFMLSLPQSETEKAMASALRAMGVEVEWSTRLETLERTGTGWAATFGTGERAEFATVFGADGIHSAVRREAGIAFEGYVHERTWSIADAEIGDWPYEPGAAHAFLNGGGDIGFIIPIGPARFRAVSNTADALAQIPGPYAVRRVLRSDTFELPIKQAASYAQPGLFLGGDAAHVHSPIGARGMNLGIEDAASFARRYVDGTLEGYEAERRPVGRQWIAFSERVLAAAQTRNPLAVAARNAAIRLVGALPPLQRIMLKRVAGIDE